MSQRKVICPSCSLKLALPNGCEHRIFRCSQCQTRFQLLETAGVIDRAVASWLTQSQPFEDDWEDEPNIPVARPPKAQVASTPHSGKTSVLEAIREPIRLVRVDNQGALFEFPARRLLENSLRCAMPRCCLQCGVTSHLDAHVIVYAGQLGDSVSMGDEHNAGQLKVGENELRHLSSEEVLGCLPSVPNVPPPADRPMPYWVCDMCSGAGMLKAQIDVSSSTGGGLCRLQILNLRRAAEFFAAAGGANTGQYRKLMAQVAAMVEAPWDSLNETTQHRVEQWFKPAAGESFLVYVPDRDRVRTEDGMSGLLLSNRRIIFHSRVRHLEAPATESIVIHLNVSGTKSNVEVKLPGWDVKHFVVDKDGLGRLKRALVLGKFRAVWH